MPDKDGGLLSTDTIVLLNQWLTNAKHQPVSTVEIEGTPATREASITEFFTSVATAAAVRVGTSFVGDIWSFDDAAQVQLEMEYGFDSDIAQAGRDLLGVKSFVNEVMEPIKTASSVVGASVSNLWDQGTSAFNAAFVNPLQGKYTEYISQVTGYAADYASKATGFASGSAQQIALQAASTYTTQTTLPTFNNVQSHSNNLIKGNFTVDDAAKMAKPNTQTLSSTDLSPYQPIVNNDVLRALGYDEQPTFDQLVGILSKDELHDNLDIALADELAKRNEDLSNPTKFSAWQTSFSNLQNRVAALQQEVKDNQYYINVAVGQENALRGLQRVQSTRSIITDPTILATYDKCLTSKAITGAESVSSFIQQNQNN